MVMSDASTKMGIFVPTCPVCKGELRFLTSGALGGPRFYAEAYTYECPTHGVVFLTREGLRGHGPDNAKERHT